VLRLFAGATQYFGRIEMEMDRKNVIIAVVVVIVVVVGGYYMFGSGGGDEAPATATATG